MRQEFWDWTLLTDGPIGRPLLSPAGAVGRGNFRPGSNVHPWWVCCVQWNSHNGLSTGNFGGRTARGPGRHCQPENQLQIHVDMRQTKEEELVLYFFVFCRYMILMWSFTYMATYFK